MLLRPAIFLDRDKTLNEDPGYLADPAAVRLLPGVTEGLQLLQAQHFPLVLISNQAGVGRGYFSETALHAVHERLTALLAAGGVQLTAAYYCLHAPSDGCACRKPAPGMLLQAAQEHHFDLTSSFMIGDKLSDLEAGRAACCTTIWLQPHAPTPLPLSADIACNNMVEAARWVTARQEAMIR